MLSLSALQSVSVTLNGSETIFAISACWTVYRGQRSPRWGGYLGGRPSVCASFWSCPSLARSVGMSILSSSSFP